MIVLAIPLAPYSGASDKTGHEITGSLWQILLRALQVRSYLLLLLGFLFVVSTLPL